MKFSTPPSRQTPSGRLRRVGFEIEYAGLDIDRAAAALAERLAASVEAGNPFCLRLQGHPTGEFRLEVDARVLKQRRHLDWLKQLGIDAEALDAQAALESTLRSVVSVVVPHELVTPPLPLDQLELVERLRATLHALHAKGTGQSLFYGFGLHMNPELPVSDADGLRNHLRAFVLLRDWLIDGAEVDWSRRLGPHIRPWPEAWVERLMDQAYTPSRAQLAKDYVRLVGSRNHELDMLPALVELEGDALLASVEEPDLVQARPTFHYRLPNCQIDQPGWRIAEAWNQWVEVERLAADAERLGALCEEWRSARQGWLPGLTGAWRRHIDQHMETRRG